MECYKFLWVFLCRLALPFHAFIKKNAVGFNVTFLHVFPLSHQKSLLVKSSFHEATFVPLLLNSVELFYKGTKETNGRQTCFTLVVHMESVSYLH